MDADTVSAAVIPGPPTQVVEGDPERLLRHFRAAFRATPGAAYRDWFRLQEEFRDREETSLARSLADDLWRMRAELAFATREESGRFFHNLAVFFGSPGPAADLSRAREGFSAALAQFSEHEESGWHARALHNFATALANLGSSAGDLQESVGLFERALEWRTSRREIARGVTLHNMGLALRRLAKVDPARAPELLERGAAALREAVQIRARHRLAEGHALSLFHLGLTLEHQAQTGSPRARLESRDCFEKAAEEFDRLGKRDSAAAARSRMTD